MPQGIGGFPNILQLVRTTSLKVLGKPGATAGAGLAGGTTSGAPTTGLFEAGDAVVAQNGHLWICSVSGSPGTWVDAGASAYTDPLTTRGDLLVRGAVSTGRLALGASGYVLQSDGTDAGWAAAAAGFADPMSTRGDLIVRGAGGTTRLALGSSGQHLGSDGTDAAWVTPSGGALTQLATAAGTGSSGVITFSSISGSYNALELHWYGRTDAALAVATVTANSDTTSGNYAWQELQANASNGAGIQNTSAANMRLIVPNGSGDTAHYYAGGRILIPHYANTAHFKIFISQHGRADGPCLEMATGLWKSTSALTSLTLTTGGGNWTTDSKFCLYGVT